MRRKPIYSVIQGQHPSTGTLLTLYVDGKWRASGNTVEMKRYRRFGNAKRACMELGLAYGPTPIQLFFGDAIDACGRIYREFYKTDFSTFNSLAK